MKIRIDNNGWLSVERAGKFKDQKCPHDQDNLVHCGDWCPLFGEPHNWETGSQAINLCMNFIHGEITDERGTK